MRIIYIVTSYFMRTVIKMTKKSKNATFDGCKINGWIEVDGKDHKFKNCIIWIEQLIKENPTKTIFLGIIITVIGGIIMLAIEYNFFQ